MPDEPALQVTNGLFRRIFRTIAICVTVAASLLVFPHWLPWMIAFWITWHAVLVATARPGYWPLIACLVIMLIRLVPPTPAMLLVAGLMMVIAVWRYKIQPDVATNSRLALVAISLLAVSWGLMFREYRLGARCDRKLELDPNRPIICIGDSLTDGLLPDHGYPAQLESMLCVPVINQGVSGISSGPAFGILERALQQHPQVVIIEVGGHDFLRWHSRSSTKANLIKLIESCRNSDCEPILMEIPRGFMIDPYASLERELAYEYDLQLIDDRWLRQVVLMGPAAPPGIWFPRSQLSDDGIHSNPRGSRRIAKHVAAALVDLYGPGILKQR